MAICLVSQGIIHAIPDQLPPGILVPYLMAHCMSHTGMRLADRDYQGPGYDRAGMTVASNCWHELCMPRSNQDHPHPYGPTLASGDWHGPCLLLLT